MEDSNAVDILICGAGAAGLTLAIDLARRGLSFRLIDQLEAPFAGSRGKGIQPRTLELFEDLGLVDQLAAAGTAYPPQRIHRADGTCHDEQAMAIGAPIPAEPYRTPLLVPQHRTEATLRARLAELGAAPHYGTRLESFVQDENGVTAMIAGPGGGATLRCRYLVGGDGGRSFVRHALGIDFPGKTLGVRAIVADLLLDGLSPDAWHRFNDGDMTRQISFCPLPEGLFQLQAPIPATGDMDLSVAGIQAFVADRLPGRALSVRAVHWASAYAMNARLAERYRVDRVFLMGDAAHIHPPTGGQGLNTSVQDAYNLGWKLAAVLEGAPEALLDSYEAERRPIAAAMLGLSTGLLEKAQQGDMTREREVQQLDLGYPGSALALERPARPDGIHAGDRAPDAPLRGAAGQPVRLFRLMQGPHWVLIGQDAPHDTAPSPRRNLHIHRIGATGDLHDAEGAFAAAYRLAPGDWLLIRPDGYVGAITGAGDGAALEAYLDAVLPIQPARAPR